MEKILFNPSDLETLSPDGREHLFCALAGAGRFEEAIALLPSFHLQAGKKQRKMALRSALESSSEPLVARVLAQLDSEAQAEEKIEKSEELKNKSLDSWRDSWRFDASASFSGHLMAKRRACALALAQSPHLLLTHKSARPLNLAPSLFPSAQTLTPMALALELGDNEMLSVLAARADYSPSLRQAAGKNPHERSTGGYSSSYLSEEGELGLKILTSPRAWFARAESLMALLSAAGADKLSAQSAVCMLAFCPEQELLRSPLNPLARTAALGAFGVLKSFSMEICRARDHTQGTPEAAAARKMAQTLCAKLASLAERMIESFKKNPETFTDEQADGLWGCIAPGSHETESPDFIDCFARRCALAAGDAFTAICAQKHFRRERSDSAAYSLIGAAKSSELMKTPFVFSAALAALGEIAFSYGNRSGSSNPNALMDILTHGSLQALDESCAFLRASQQSSRLSALLLEESWILRDHSLRKKGDCLAAAVATGDPEKARAVLRELPDAPKTRARETLKYLKTRSTSLHRSALSAFENLLLEAELEASVSERAQSAPHKRL